MQDELWTTADIARELGFADPAVARSFIRRARIESVERAGDRKLYPANVVRAAVDEMPGRGARTDLGGSGTP